MHSDCKLAAIDVTYLKMIHATPPDVKFSFHRTDIYFKTFNIQSQSAYREHDSPAMVTGQLMLFTSILPLLIVYFLFVVFFPSEDAFKAPQRSVDKPFRLCVSDVFKGNVKYGNGPLMSIFLMSVFISPICV